MIMEGEEEFVEEEPIAEEEPKEDIEMRDIKHELDLLFKAEITHINFREYYEKHISAVRIIDTQISKCIKDLQDATAEEKRIIDGVRQSGAENDEMQPRELVVIKTQKNRLLEDMKEWLAMKARFGNVLVEKFQKALQLSKAIDIEQTLVNRMNEFVREQTSRWENTFRTSFDILTKTFGDVSHAQLRSFESTMLRIARQVELRDEIINENVKISPRAKQILDEIKAEKEKIEAERDRLKDQAKRVEEIQTTTAAAGEEKPTSEKIVAFEKEIEEWLAGREGDLRGLSGLKRGKQPWQLNIIERKVAEHKNDMAE